MSAITDIPATLRGIAHYVKIANEYAQRDVVIYYWSKLNGSSYLIDKILALYYAVQQAMGIDKSSPEAIQFLTTVLSNLERVCITISKIKLSKWIVQIKKESPGNDALTQDVVAQSYIENHCLKLFNCNYFPILWRLQTSLDADKLDREGNFGKNVIKAFYTSGYLFDILATFGEIDENIQVIQAI